MYMSQPSMLSSLTSLTLSTSSPSQTCRMGLFSGILLEERQLVIGINLDGNVAERKKVRRVRNLDYSPTRMCDVEVYTGRTLC